MCNWESWEQLEAKYYIRLCIPGSDLVWPCWITAALRVCVSKFTHDWHGFLVQINGIKCRPHCWLLWSNTWHTPQLAAFMPAVLLVEQTWWGQCHYRCDTQARSHHLCHGNFPRAFSLINACVYMTLCILVPISICLYWGSGDTVLNFLETNAAN